MKLGSIFTFSASLIFAISMITRFNFGRAAGFTIDLIHRDLIHSPSIFSSLTFSERVTNALRRSFNRVSTLTSKRDNFPQTASSTDIFPDNGEYLMKLSIGTPPVETLAVADTGSDLTWIQCKPCPDCFRQKAPLFEPKLSSTYKPISCASSPCIALLGRTSCIGSDDDGACRYMIGYGDASRSSGDLATESITLGSVTIPNVMVGCGHDDHGSFGARASGVVGLGGGKLSLITQMAALTRAKFSYCLGHGTSRPSKMSFGDDAVVSGDDVAVTPFVSKTPPTFYFLTLEGISVGNRRMEYYSPSISNATSEQPGEGNIIIDSGTTLTFLPGELYGRVVGQVERQMKSRRADDPEGLLGLCFVSRDVANFPEIIFHFKGADWRLKPRNSFVKTRKNHLCLGFAPANGVAIFGNLAQMDFLVGYDLGKSTLSFKPKDCSKS